MRLLSVFLAFFSLFSRGTNHNDPEELAGEILEQTAVFAHKRYPLNACGTGMMMPGGAVQKLTLCFQVKTFLSRNQLRILLIECGEELLRQIKSNKHIQRFLVKNPFTIKEIGIVIYNKDKEGNEPYDPLIATAEISGGILTFRTTDPNNTHTFNNRFKETYEEALEIIKQNQMKNMPLNSLKK